MLTITVASLGTSAIFAGATAVVILGLIRLLQTLARRAGARPSTVRGIRDTLWIIWVLLAGSALVTATGLASEFTVLTISGIAGLVLSLSLQAVFSNIIAGILLLRDGAVRVGDTIEFGGVHGRVARVALRNTWVVTDAGTVAIVGNSALMSGPLVNLTAGPRFRATLET